MATFYCKSCKLKFEDEGTKVEWIDAAFGPCTKLIAKCPQNGDDCDEYSPPKQGKETPQAPNCYMNGGCCGCNMGR